MTNDPHEPALHRCACPDCAREPSGSTAQQHRLVNRLVARADECTRRLLVGFLAQQHGRGGITLFHLVTGLDRDTIARGQSELRRPLDLPPGRVRRPGAGRKRAEAKFPGC